MATTLARFKGEGRNQAPVHLQPGRRSVLHQLPMPDACDTCLVRNNCRQHRPEASNITEAKEILFYSYLELRRPSLSLPGSAPTSPRGHLPPPPHSAPCSPLLSPVTPASPDYSSFSLLTPTMGEDGPVCRKCHRDKVGGAHALCRTGYNYCNYPDHRPDCPGCPPMPTPCTQPSDTPLPPSPGGEGQAKATTTTTTTTTVTGCRPSTGVVATASLLNSLNSLVAANQQHQAPPQHPPYSGPSMEHLRREHGATADAIMANLRELVPALAPAPSATLAPTPLPSSHLQQQSVLQEVASLEARLANLRTSLHTQHLPQAAPPSYGAPPPSYSATLPSYGVPLPPYGAPLPSYSAPLQHQHPPPQYATAEEYLRTQQRLPAASPAEEVMQQLVRLLQPSTTLTPPSSQHCFIPTPPAAAAPPHRGGAAGKSTRAAEWAKLCKAPHASKASADRVNQNLWSFGFIKHLVATKTGVLPPLPQEEEVARLRHFLDIMETTALHSSGSDFQCHGWQIARDYDARVMADLEQGEVSWSTIATAASVTRNYNQAVHCNSKPAPVTRRGGQGGGADDGDAPRICKSYNEGTCTFEAANPSRPCKFSHICSHCAAAGFSFQHKQVDCRHRRSGARRGSASTTPATTASQQS